jgi:2,5-diketo-D-gluconate reductase B
MNTLSTTSGKDVFPVGIGTFNIASRENPDTEASLRYKGYKNVEPVRGNEGFEIFGVQYSLQHCQNYLDTAGLYGAGYTDEVLGWALDGAGVERDGLFVAHNVWKCDYGDVRSAIEQHLAMLGVNFFDVAGPHSPDTKGWKVPLWQSTMEDFAVLKEEGLIRGVSVSNFSVKEIEEAERLLGFPVTTAQAGYSVLDQGVKKRELRDYCNSKGIQFIGYRALSGGVIKDETVREIAAEHEVSPAQVGLAFVIHEGVLPITKSLAPAHIKDNIAAAELVLSQSEVDRIIGRGLAVAA